MFHVSCLVPLPPKVSWISFLPWDDPTSPTARNGAAQQFLFFLRSSYRWHKIGNAAFEIHKNYTSGKSEREMWDRGTLLDIVLTGAVSLSMIHKMSSVRAVPYMRLSRWFRYRCISNPSSVCGSQNHNPYPCYFVQKRFHKCQSCGRCENIHAVLFAAVVASMKTQTRLPWRNEGGQPAHKVATEFRSNAVIVLVSQSYTTNISRNNVIVIDLDHVTQFKKQQQPWPPSSS